jgi:hypothetical protein
LLGPTLELFLNSFLGAATPGGEIRLCLLQSGQELDPSANLGKRRLCGQPFNRFENEFFIAHDRSLVRCRQAART